MDKGSNPASRTGGINSVSSENHGQETPGAGVPPEHPSGDLTQNRHRGEGPEQGDTVEVRLTEQSEFARLPVDGHREVNGVHEFAVSLRGALLWFAVLRDYLTHWRWPEEKADGVSHSGGEGASVDAGATAPEKPVIHPAIAALSKPKRKAPKEGLCKRRGCSSRAVTTDRLCEAHMKTGGASPLLPGARGALPAAEAGTSDTESHAVSAGFPGAVGEPIDVSKFLDGKRYGWERTRVASVGKNAAGAPYFTAGTTEGLPYYKETEGVHWRWPEAVPEEAEQPNDGQLSLVGDGFVSCGEASPADVARHAQSHGEAASPTAEQARAALPALDGRTTDPLALYGACITMDCGRAAAPGSSFCADCLRILGKEVCGCHGAVICPEHAAANELARLEELEKEAELAAAIVLDRGIGAMLGTTHGKNGVPELPAVPPVRTCIGLPGAVGDDVCGTVLGPDVVGPRCSRCAAQLAAMGGRGCATVGCRKSAEPDSRYCLGHKRVSEAVAYVVLDQAFEAAWTTLLESSHLDRRTVEVCKALRDKEVTP